MDRPFKNPKVTSPCKATYKHTKVQTFTDTTAVSAVCDAWSTVKGLGDI